MKLIEHFKELSLHPKNAEELKGLILQLAVQGKLTESWRANNPNLEPASELHKRIEAEKKKLIAKKKIKKEKTLPPLENDEMPYELPEGWVWCRLIDISSITGGFAFKSGNYADEGVRVIRISDFDEHGFKNHKVVRHVYTDELFQYVLEDRNILIAMTGGTVGKSLFVNHVNETMVVNQRVATIKIIQPIFEAYVNCVIPTRLIQDVIEEAKNSTNDNISMSDIKGFNIPLPTLEEQKAIVEIVNTLFAEVEQLESLTKERLQLKESFVISALARLTEAENTQQEWNFLQQHFSSFFTKKKNIKSLRETILQLALQGKLTANWRENNKDVQSASDLIDAVSKLKNQFILDKKIRKDKVIEPVREKEIPYVLPINWKWCRLNEFATLINGDRGKNYPSKAHYVDSGIPFITAGNLGERYLKHENFNYITEERFSLLRSGQVEKDDILYCLRGSLGKCAIVEGIDLGAIASSLCIIRIVDGVMPDFLLSYFMSPLGTQMILRHDNGTAQPNLSATDVKTYLFPLPPIEEQKAIVEKVNSLMALCDELEQQIDNSQTQIEQLMQSCLNEVFEHESN